MKYICLLQFQVSLFRLSSLFNLRVNVTVQDEFLYRDSTQKKYLCLIYQVRISATNWSGLIASLALVDYQQPCKIFGKTGIMYLTIYKCPNTSDYNQSRIYYKRTLEFQPKNKCHNSIKKSILFKIRQSIMYQIEKWKTLKIKQ